MGHVLLFFAPFFSQTIVESKYCRIFAPQLSNQLLSFFVIGYFFLMCTTRRFSIFSIDCVICSKNTKKVQFIVKVNCTFSYLSASFIPCLPLSRLLSSIAILMDPGDVNEATSYKKSIVKRIRLHQ